MIFGDQIAGPSEQLSKDYVNPNALAAMPVTLHVCESLFGDWRAGLCLLMQDAADVDSLNKLHTNTGRPLLSHSLSAPTNKRLIKWLSKHHEFSSVNIEGDNAKSCGIYYANAVWFLKKTGGMSGPLKQRRLILKESQIILSTTISQLSKLELIIAFGRVAYEALQLQFQLNTPWKVAKGQRDLIRHKNLLIGVTNHPMARGVSEIEMENRLDGFLSEWRRRRSD